MRIFLATFSDFIELQKEADFDETLLNYMNSQHHRVVVSHYSGVVRHAFSHVDVTGEE